MSIAPERSRVVFRNVERDLRGLSSKLGPESVHRFRTSARRLQTLLEDIAPKRDRHQKKLVKLLGRIRKRAGKVRDLDVQLTTLRALRLPQDPRRKTQFSHDLIEQRSRAEKKLKKTLTDETVREIRKRLKRAGKDFDPATAADPLTVARQILDPVATVQSPLTEDLLHQHRILTKRARYATELATDSPEAAILLGQLKHLQDILGDWHDWLLLTRSASERLGAVHESSLVAALHNVTGAKFRGAVALLSSKRVAAKTHLARTEPIQRKESAKTPTRAQTISAA